MESSSCNTPERVRHRTHKATTNRQAAHLLAPQRDSRQIEDGVVARTFTKKAIVLAIKRDEAQMPKRGRSHVQLKPLRLRTESLNARVSILPLQNHIPTEKNAVLEGRDCVH